MDPHGDFHGHMIVVALAVAICGVVALLVFLLWIGHHDKRDSRNSANRGKAARMMRKKRRK